MFQGKEKLKFTDSEVNHRSNIFKEKDRIASIEQLLTRTLLNASYDKQQMKMKVPIKGKKDC